MSPCRLTALVVLLLMARGSLASAADAPAPTGGGIPSFEGEAATTWTTRLSDPDAAIRRKAAYALFTLGPAASTAAVPLAHALADTDPYVRDTAYRAVERLKDDARAAVSILCSLLHSDREIVRQRAASLLVRIGPLTPAAVPNLVTALASDDPVVRELAATSLGAIGTGAKPAADALRDLLDDGSPLVASHAAQALARIDPQALITTYWSSGVDHVRYVILIALAAMAPPPDASAAVALHAVAHGDPGAQSAATSVFKGLGDRARASVPSVLALIDAPDERVRISAVVTLGHIGRGSQAVVPTLLQLIEQNPGRLAIFAAASLGRLGNEATAAVPVLIGLLARESQSDLRREAATALLRIGPTAREPAAAALRKAVDDEGDATPVVILYALACLSEKDRVRLLKRVIDDAMGDDPIRRNSATWTLLDAGPESPREVVDACVSAFAAELGSRSAARRLRSVSALVALGPLAKAALPALEKLASDSDADVRRELLFVDRIRR